MAKTQPNPEPKEEKAYVASVRTALSGPEDAVVKKLPEAYLDATVSEVLSYLTNREQLEADEVTVADSVRAEMKEQYTVEVNGKPVKAKSTVRDLLEEKEHRGVKYNALDIEIASVQQGGLARLLE